MTEAETKKKKSDDEFIWIYGTNKVKQEKKKYYEFHPKLQDHIETCYQNGRKTCKLYIFGVIWTLDFAKMIKINPKSVSWSIRRIRKIHMKKRNVVGVSGANYEKATSYTQTDGICHVCLYKPTIPTKIDTCGHEFCYMCLKSNFTLGMECPTCRAEIPVKLFDWPIRNDLDIHMECPEDYANDCVSMFNTQQKTEKSVPRSRKEAVEPLRRSARITRTKYYWIYESHSNGWYRYDPKNEKYLEECFARKKKQCSLFIAGYKMTIKIKERLQSRNCGFERHVRKIKRIRSVDIDKYAVKGIAGIRGYVRVIE